MYFIYSVLVGWYIDSIFNKYWLDSKKKICKIRLKFSFSELSNFLIYMIKISNQYRYLLTVFWLDRILIQYLINIALILTMILKYNFEILFTSSVLFFHLPHPLILKKTELKDFNKLQCVMTNLSLSSHLIYLFRISVI